MIKLSRIKLLSTFLVSTAGLLLFFISVHPADKPLPYIFIPVLLIWIVLFSGFSLGVHLVTGRVSLVAKMIVFILVSSAVLLLLLSGVGRLSTSDVLLVAGLVSVGTFYFYRTWS